MAATGDFSPTGVPTVWWGTDTAPALPVPYDDGLNAARTNLDRTITALSEKIDTDRDNVSIDDLVQLSRAMSNLVEARMELGS
jgi:hypothetical protein